MNNALFSQIRAGGILSLLLFLVWPLCHALMSVMHTNNVTSLKHLFMFSATWGLCVFLSCSSNYLWVSLRGSITADYK